MKNKPKGQLEFCVFEGANAESKEYFEVMALLAEDLFEMQFYLKEPEAEKGKISLWCVDKYYPESIYRFHS